MDTFALSVDELNGTAVVHVAGEVDMTSAPQLREQLFEVVAAGYHRVVLDLMQTEFLDSTGLGAIVATLKRLRAHKGEMRVACTTPRVCRVFEVSRVNQVIPMYPSVDAACG